MRLPNKICSFESSYLSRFPKILELLDSGDMSCGELYGKIKSNFSGLDEFLDALDCLYALGAITLTRKGLISHAD